MAIWRNVADEKLAAAKYCKHLKANCELPTTEVAGFEQMSCRLFSRLT